MKKKLLIGFQLETEDQENPDEFSSSEILSFEFLRDYLLHNPDILNNHKILPIFDGDVENATILELPEDLFE